MSDIVDDGRVQDLELALEGACEEAELWKKKWEEEADSHAESMEMFRRVRDERDQLKAQLAEAKEAWKAMQSALFGDGSTAPYVRAENRLREILGEEGE